MGYPTKIKRIKLENTVNEGIKDAFWKINARWEQICVTNFLEFHKNTSRNDVLPIIRTAIRSICEGMVASLTPEITNGLMKEASVKNLNAEDLKKAISDRIDELVTNEQDVLLKTISSNIEIAWEKRKEV